MMVLLRAAGHHSARFVRDEEILDWILMLVVVGCPLECSFSNGGFQSGRRESGTRGEVDNGGRRRARAS